jgi:hypothetical protein
VEPPIFDSSLVEILERDEPWCEQRLRVLEERIRKRLGDLSSRLGEADGLDGAFSAGDLLMVSVLRRLEGSGILEEYPNLAAYVARGEARPAFKRAFDAQLAVFNRNQTKDREPLSRLASAACICLPVCGGRRTNSIGCRPSARDTRENHVEPVGLAAPWRAAPADCDRGAGLHARPSAST